MNVFKGNGFRVETLRNDKKQTSAEQKSCLCGEKQTLLRQINDRQEQNLPSNTIVKENKKERIMVWYRTAVTALVCALFCAAASVRVEAASTLSTNFAAVFVENLKVGGIYNLTETARFPMWVSYNGDVPVDIKYETVLPNAGEMVAGYEPVPDLSWVTISKKTASLLPDETDTTDVTISIPNDEKYLGKKYQVYVQATTVPPANAKGTGMAFALSLKGRVQFSIARKPPTEKELKDLNRKKARESQGVIITPEKFMVLASTSDVEVRITQDVPLKIINPSSERTKIYIEAVEPQTSGISLPRGYEKGDYKNFKFSKQSFTLKKDGIMNIEMTANIGKMENVKLFYAVKILIKTGTLEINRFVRVYIN